ncbi:site-2 protease family protein [Hyphomicrobium sp. CS1GBMeth3]|uniref:metalloprotease n=1 Tax=Hyphomicrobium sp. CS1GBMeth3 TaxID=1892845 RepID=UPI000931ACD3|nr:site-2 protease family protein [Hyphomicrobium sp. CS1GBMeth3]
MTFLADLLLSLYFFARGLVDALLGRRRRRYVNAIAIRAPRDVVWSAASASSITFEGLVPIEIRTALRPGSTEIYEGTVRVGDTEFPMAFREVESRPPVGQVIEVLREGSAPNIAPGTDYFVVCTLEEDGDGTVMTTAHELTHETFASRFLIPLGARQNSRRLRDYCEAKVGAPPPARNRLGAALVTGALTYASFGYLFDWIFAAILLLLLIVHEAGHALAMRWVGLPVQGIYFIPFLGGVAVAAAPHRSEGERGFVALMGPGLSLLSTGAFLVTAYATGEQLFLHLAFASAVLNGLNLAPVLPLDGGHVLDSALSASDPEFVAIINMLALMIGIGASVYLGWYVLTVLLLLTAPVLVHSGKAKRRAELITPAGRNWLVAGYLATIAFYVAVIAHYMA